MKATFTLFLTLLSFALSAQQTLYDTIVHDGRKRAFILYIPANYSGQDEVPLLFNFHGYSSNAHDQMYYGDFRPLADTAGFLLVHPQGSKLNGVTHWNVGGWTIGSTVDDVGFTEALLDTLSARYRIDSMRVYSTGMSNGGYMSLLLACQLSNRFAAVASVTGSMTPEMYKQCDPQRPIAVMQIHGTADGIVPYTGTGWSISIKKVLEYWVKSNHCYEEAVKEEISDKNPDDGSTVEHLIYSGGSEGVSVEHFKVLGGGHTWPGTVYGSTGTNYDIDASLEVWHFLSRYSLSGRRINVGMASAPAENDDARIYPNPVVSTLHFRAANLRNENFRIFSSYGVALFSGRAKDGEIDIDFSSLPAGIYILQLQNHSYRIVHSK